MNFFTLTVFAISIFANQAMAVAIGEPEVQELVARQGRPVAFNVAPEGAACGTGTTIFCSPSPGNSCKGNFSPAQASIVVTKAAGNCHIRLYPGDNQSGGGTESLNTDTTGTCVFTGVATWKSYGIYCN